MEIFFPAPGAGRMQQFFPDQGTRSMVDPALTA